MLKGLMKSLIVSKSIIIELEKFNIYIDLVY